MKPWRARAATGLAAMALSLAAMAQAAPASSPTTPSSTPATPSFSAPPAQTLRFAPERDYGPFVFAGDDGQVQGLSVDLLQRVAAAADLRVQTLAAAPLAEQLALLRQGQVDLVSSLRPTPERAAYLAFTQPYVQVPAIVVVAAARRQSAPDPGATGAAALSALAGRPVAVGAGYGVESFVRSRHPAVRWVAVPDDVQALQGVAQGRFDAAVVDAASAAFVARRHALQGLASAGPIGFDYALSFAVPKARADLVERLDRAILALPLAERTAILQRWMAPLDGDALMAQSRTSTWLGAGLLALAALLAAAGLWRWWRRPPASPPAP